jgi:heme exporter protein C
MEQSSEPGLGGAMRHPETPRLGARLGPRLGRRLGRRLAVAAVAAALLAVVLALAVAPEAAIQGQSQRLMYVHVPSAWTAFLCFGVLVLCSVAQLLQRPGPWPRVARAAAEVGVAATALTIAEGSLWGHIAWGVWWAWDPRLVSTALMLVSSIAYLALRALPGDAARVERRAAFAGLVFAIEVPVVHFSVLWWRTLHQPPTLLRPSLSAPPIAPLMLVTLLVAVLASTLAAAWYVVRRTEQLAPPPLPVPRRAATLEVAATRAEEGAR